MGENKQINIKKVTFWEFLLKMFNKNLTNQPSKEAREESISVRSLKKHLTILQEIIDDQAITIKSLNKQVQVQDKRNMEEKLIDGAIQLFSGNNAPTPQTTPKPQGGEIPLSNYTNPPLESGENWTDEEILIVVNKIPQDRLQNVLQVPNGILKQQIKNEYNKVVSDETIIKAKEIIRTKVT